MARYKAEHRTQTREAIVSSAAAMVRERGLDGAGVAEVMKSIGLTHGGFYAHFDGKDSLQAAALERAFADSPKRFAMLARLAEEAGDRGTVAERFLADERVDDVGGTCPSAALASEMHRHPMALQALFEQGIDASARALGNANGLAPSQGEAAWAATAMLVGALSLMRAIPDAEKREAIRIQVADWLRRPPW